MTSRIETLLENESVTLKELMDEDDILQECKGQNHKLIEFLIAPAIMEELVKLITTEPSPEIDDKIKYKYPNIACELLTSDVSQILDKIVEDNILLDKIYSFLLDKNTLNPLLASFFTKVLGLLLARKTNYIFEYLKSKEGFIGSLLAHINTSAVMDLLMRLVTCESYETKPKILTWLDEQNIVERLVDLIHPSHTDEIHFNASTVLCDIVRSGREQLGLDQPLTDPLMDKVESVTTLSKLLCNMLDGEKKESVIVNGLSVLQTILEYRRQLSSFDDWRPMSELCNDQLPASEVERMEKAQVSVTTALKPRLADTARLLTEPPPVCYLCTRTRSQSLQTNTYCPTIINYPIDHTQLKSTQARYN